MNIQRIPPPLKSLFLVVFLSCCLPACSKDNSKQGAAQTPLEISVAEVQQQDVSRMVEFVGQTKGAIDAEVRARVDGVILEIHFKEGTPVTEGELLYTIDPAPFAAKVSAAQAKLAEANVRLVKAESDLKRIRPLAEMKAVSARDLDTAIANEGAARSTVDAAKSEVESAEIELGYTKILAPVSGMIGLSKAKIGEFVGKAPNPVVLTTVSKLDPIHVRFSITEKDYLYFTRMRQKDLAAGETPKKRALELILADGSVHPEVGEVASLEGQMDAATGSLTVDAAFPNPQKLIRPGQFAKIRAAAETVAGALVIPRRAVRELQGQFQVFVVREDNTVEQRTITLGSQTENLQVVESGLTDKERVALDGLDRLRTGMAVTPRIVDIEQVG